MATSYNATSSSGLIATTTGLSFSHQGGATIKGILVFTTVVNLTTNLIKSVEYGGITMERINSAVAVDTSGELAIVQLFFLGENIPSGEQTITVTKTGDTYLEMCATCISVNADGNTSLSSPVLLQESGTYTEQNVDDGSTGINSMRFAYGYYGGSDTLPVGSNSTHLYGLSLSGYSRSVTLCRETTAGQGSRPVGFSQATSDDRAAIHIAVIDSGGAVANTSNFFQLF